MGVQACNGNGTEGWVVYSFIMKTRRVSIYGLIANLEYRGNIYSKMFKNTDWRGKTKPIMAQLPFLHSTNIPQA